MSAKGLENRVTQLERKVEELQVKLKGSKNGPAQDAWREAVKKFAGDEGLQSIFREAMKLREEDRKRTRPRKKSARKESK
jgi:hypothetical protein